MFQFEKTAIRKRKLADPDPEDGYWLNKTPQERLQALEFLRQNHHKGDDAAQTFQRVFRITRGKRG